MDRGEKKKCGRITEEGGRMRGRRRKSGEGEGGEGEGRGGRGRDEGEEGGVEVEAVGGKM